MKDKINNQKKILHYILLSLSLGLLVALGFYIYKNQATFQKIKDINLGIIFLLIGLHAFNYLLLGLSHRYPLLKHDIKLKFIEWYGLCTISDVFNLLLPASGGTAIRIMYINKKKKLAMGNILSMSLATVMVGIMLLGVAGSIYFHLHDNHQSKLFFALKMFFLATIVGSLLTVFASDYILKILKKEKKYDLKQYIFDKDIFINSLLCYVGMLAIHPLKVYLSFKAIDVDISVMSSIEISLMLLCSSFFQILPGNMGIRELTTAYVAQQYGIQFETALLASLVDRAILLLFLFPFGAYFYWRLFLNAILPDISLAKIGASSRIPLIKRLVNER